MKLFVALLSVVLAGCVLAPSRVAVPSASFTLRFEAGVSPLERAEVLRGAAMWSDLGAVELSAGEDWASVPPRSSGTCTTEIFVAWASPDDPTLRGPFAEAVGVGVSSCSVRYVALVRGRVALEQIARVSAHEIGHAMGLEHDARGVMSPTLGDVPDRTTCEDWARFCEVFVCHEDPCP